MATNAAAAEPVTPKSSVASDFYERLHALQMIGLWEMYGEYSKVVKNGLLDEPPYMWRWRDYYPLLLESGSIGIDSDLFQRPEQARGGVERRNLVMYPTGNPAGATCTTMACGVQYIKPGETAPCHRHDPAAIRFIIEGRGAYTAVEGEKFHMEPGDLILTPRWTWHEHGNDGNEPVIWMDGLDSPFVLNYLHADFWQPYRDGYFPQAHAEGHTRRRLGNGFVRPMKRIAERALPVIYPWSEVYPELIRQRDAAENVDPYDGVILEYVNPVSGGPTLPTMSCRMQLIPAGQSTQTHRHTARAIYRVFKGSGWSEVGGHRIEWEAGDVFCLPIWTWHSHGANRGEDAILFTMCDQPLLEPFDLYQEEARQ